MVDRSDRASREKARTVTMRSVEWTTVTSGGDGSDRVRNEDGEPRRRSVHRAGSEWSQTRVRGAVSEQMAQKESNNASCGD